MSYIIRQSANRNDLLIEREHRKGGTAVALIFMADDMRDTAAGRGAGVGAQGDSDGCAGVE